MLGPNVHTGREGEDSRHPGFTICPRTLAGTGLEGEALSSHQPAACGCSIIESGEHYSCHSGKQKTRGSAERKRGEDGLGACRTQDQKIIRERI